MGRKKKIALLDCNNFYVSCERLFRPDLKNKPVAVLSNNDGCIIARSNEVKAMGITWEYVHNVRDTLDKNKVNLFSSNYNLYGDISDRVMEIIKSHFPETEVYSIDEAFFDCSSLKEAEVIPKLQHLKQQILRWTGIPVSIGVAPNKTLAKLMNHTAKKQSKHNGVCYFNQLSTKDNYVNVKINKVWGVGSQITKTLLSMNISTIGEFIALDENIVKKIFTVVGLRLYYELKQQYILEVKNQFKNKKEIMTSRTFGQEVTNLDELQTAIYTFLHKGCLKLKRQKLYAQKFLLFIQTDPYKENFREYNKKVALDSASNDPEVIWSQLQPLVIALYEKGVLYKKAGLLLTNLTTAIQTSIFDGLRESKSFVPKHNKWHLRANYFSKKYTSSWNDLPIIY